MSDACRHEGLTKVNAMLQILHPPGKPESDDLRYMLEVEVRCAECGTRFAFAGCAMGLTFKGPSVSGSRLKLFAPVVPDPHGTSIHAGVVETLG